MEQEIQLVVFTLHDAEYAVNILHVQEINRMLPITRVPRAPEYDEGVVNLRGNVIPVINLHKRLGLSPRIDTDQTRILVCRCKDVTCGAIVDQVTEVLKLPYSSLEDASGFNTAAEPDFIKGVGKVGDRLIILLTLDEVLGV